MGTKDILVVDDDAKVRRLLRRCLEGDGHSVREACDATAARRAFAHGAPDLVTLDLTLGEEDGLDFAREIRRSHDVPIVMVTGRDDVIDKVVGLEIGADDYVTKPFHVREVQARIRSVLRRAQGAGVVHVEDAETALDLDGLTIDLDRMAVTDRNGAPCDVTTADIKLLRAFVENPKRALSRDRLMDLIDGPQWTPLDRTIDNQVARLRKKIERDATRPELIRTVRGVGYMLSEAPHAASADT